MHCTIAVAVGVPAFQHAVERGLPDFAQARLCDGPDGLVNAVRAGGIDLVLSDLHDVNGEPMVGGLERVRIERPTLRALFYVPAAAPALEELRLAAAKGLAFDLAFRPAEDLAAAVRRALALPPIDGAVRILARDLVPIAGAATRPFVTIAALRPSAHLTANWIAEHLEVPGRTERGRFAREGVISPGQIIGYCLALTATWLLQVEGWPPGQVALVLDLPTVAALDGRLQHTVGLTLEGAQLPGAFTQLRDQVIAELRRGPVAQRAARRA